MRSFCQSRQGLYKHPTGCSLEDSHYYVHSNRQPTDRSGLWGPVRYGFTKVCWEAFHDYLLPSHIGTEVDRAYFRLTVTRMSPASMCMPKKSASTACPKDERKKPQSIVSFHPRFMMSAHNINARLDEGVSQHSLETAST